MTTKHLDGSFEEDDGGGAVHVVVAVEEDGFFLINCPLDAIDGRAHAEHEEGIVQLRGIGVEEGVGFAGIVDAAGQQELGDDGRQMRRGSQCCCFFRMRRGHDPALHGISARDC